MASSNTFYGPGVTLADLTGSHRSIAGTRPWSKGADGKLTEVVCAGPRERAPANTLSCISNNGEWSICIAAAAVADPSQALVADQ